ncbi:MAG: hypothetical protein ACE5JS_10075 [Nitrospinota bacterium]
MSTEHPISPSPDPPSIRWAQRLILGLFFALVGGIVVWIVHLIRLSWRLRDVPSASVGISLVAIPVFLILLGVVNYVFWGLRRGGKENR